VGFREKRVARNEVAAREINEAIEESDTRPAGTFIHVLCECGVEDCERVLAVTRPLYERVRNDPRQSSSCRRISSLRSRMWCSRSMDSS
jgi:hypothetical protein